MRSSLLVLLVSGFMIAIASLPVLALAEGFWKYLLAGLQVSVMVTILISLMRSVEYRFRSCYGFGLPDLSAALAGLLMLFSVLFFDGTYMSCALAFVVVSFIPGYVIARLLAFRWRYTVFELIVVSYGASIPLTSVITLALLPILQGNIVVGRAILLGVFSFMSIIPILSEMLAKKNTEPVRFGTKLIPAEAFGLCVLLIIFVTAVFSTYLQMDVVNSLVGSDVSRNLSATLVLLRTPQGFGSGYPFFHLYQASILVIANSPIAVTHVTLAFGGFVSILAFFVMAKAYFDSYHKGLAIIATIIWVLAAGLGWLYVLFQVLAGAETLFPVLNGAFGKTYWDIFYGLGMTVWLWYRPSTIGFVLLCSILYLLRRADLSMRAFIPISAVMIVGLYFTHIPELLVFAFLFTIIALFSRTVELQTRWAAMGMLLALPLEGIMVLFLQMRGFPSSLPISLLFLLIAASSLACYFSRKEWSVRWNLDMGKVARRTAFLLSVICLSGVFTWCILIPDFSYSSVYPTLFVPWMLYPVLLGVCSLLGLGAIPVMAGSWSRFSKLVPFVLLFLLTPLLGRFLSVLNIYVADVGFWERRMIDFTFLGAAMLATTWISWAFSGIQQGRPRRLNSRWDVDFRSLISVSMVALVVGAGCTSTFLSISYWGNRPPLFDGSETSSIAALCGYVRLHPDSPIHTVTQMSKIALDFVGAPRILALPHVWRARFPEIPLTFFFDIGLPSPFFYLQQRDIQTLNTNYADSYFTRHFLMSLSPEMTSQTTWYYSATPGAAPVDRSDCALVVPRNSTSSNLDYAYDMLSFGFRNFTVMNERDSAYRNFQSLIFPQDVNSTEQLQQLVTLANAGKTVSVLCSNDYLLAADQVLNLTSGSEFLLVDRVEGTNGTVWLGTQIQALDIQPLAQATVSSWYSDGTRLIPFCIQRSFGSGELLVLNTRPLVDAAKSESSIIPVLFSKMSPLWDTTGLPAERRNRNAIFPESYLVTREMELMGRISGSCHSFFLAPNQTIPSLSLVLDSGTMTLTNVSEISADRVTGIVFSIEQATLPGGIGFYAAISTSGMNFTLQGANPRVSWNSVLTGPGSQDSVRRIELGTSNSSALFYMRQLQLMTIGYTKMHECYSYHLFGKSLRSFGNDVQIWGETALSVYLADSFILVPDFAWAGDKRLEPALITWDETTSVGLGFFFFIPLFVISIAVASIGRRISGRERKDNLAGLPLGDEPLYS